ncbi:hypothetical protein, partial [Pontibacter rugosus]
ICKKLRGCFYLVRTLSIYLYFCFINLLLIYMKTILPFAFLIFFNLNAFSQSNFQKGYYINFNGDSTTAFIKNEDWKRNPKTIEVKNSLESTSSEKLTTKQVQAFGFINGDLYHTFAVDVDMSPTSLNQIRTDAAPSIIRDTVMLRTLVKGEVNLYVLTDKESKTHFYIGKGAEEPKELLNQKVKRSTETGVAFHTLEIYKGLLSVYLGGCGDLQAKIQKTPFQQNAIKDLVSTYNACIAPATENFSAKKEKVFLKVGVVAGYSFYTYKFSDATSFEGVSGADFTGNSATAGVALNLVLPRNHGRWTIANEIMWKPYTASSSYEKKESANKYESATTEFKLTYLGINNMIRYSMGTGVMRPFLSVGVANNLLISDNSTQHKETYFYGQSKTHDGAPLESMRKHEQALLIGLGISTDKYAAEARYERGNGFSSYSYLKSNKTAFSLQLAYFLR